MVATCPPRHEPVIERSALVVVFGDSDDDFGACIRRTRRVVRFGDYDARSGPVGVRGLSVAAEATHCQDADGTESCPSDIFGVDLQTGHTTYLDDDTDGGNVERIVPTVGSSAAWTESTHRVVAMNHAGHSRVVASGKRIDVKSLRVSRTSHTISWMQGGRRRQAKVA